MKEYRCEICGRTIDRWKMNSKGETVAVLGRPRKFCQRPACIAKKRKPAEERRRRWKEGW